jgi:hypothetical protein
MDKGWYKSSFSMQVNCVEVSVRDDDNRLIRSSRSRMHMLAFTKAEWDAFIAGVKAGEFDGDR